MTYLGTGLPVNSTATASLDSQILRMHPVPDLIAVILLLLRGQPWVEQQGFQFLKIAVTLAQEFPKSFGVPLDGVPVTLK